LDRRKRSKNNEKIMALANENDDALSMQRTATILEMTRFQEEEPLVDIPIGNESDVLENDVSLKESEEETEMTNDKIKVDAYMASREMTELQERWNALTMIPSPLYCIYYILAGKWLDDSVAQTDILGDHFNQGTKCIQSSWFPNVHAMPPLAVMFVTLGIAIHAPFSFIYHWKYAHALPPGIARTDHVSRRLDQAMIHVASAFLAYATSASWEYFLANILYNADCFHRQFHKEIFPRRNQIRIAISMVFYTIPILFRDVTLFFECWAVILVSVWLFVRYPLGGWSHCSFHLVIALLPPLLMEAACQISQAEIQHAAQCARIARGES
jgi:hypothetical protein